MRERSPALTRLLPPRDVAAAAAAGAVCAAATVAVLDGAARVLADPATASSRALPMAAAALLVAAAHYGSERALVRGVTAAVYELREQACEIVARAELERLEGPRRSAVLAALTDDVSAVADALPVVPHLVTQALAVAACLAWLGWSVPRALGGLLLLLALGLATYQLPMRRAARRFVAADRVRDELFVLVQGAVRGHRQLALHRGRARQLERDVAQTAEAHRQQVLRASILFAAAAQWGAALFFVALGALLLGRAWVLDQDSAATAIIALLYLAVPLGEVLFALPQLARGSAALAHLRAVLGELPVEEEAAAPVPLGFQRLVLRGVTRTRTDGERTFRLGPVDLELRPGEIVFLTGGNGSGKSTLLDLLLGLAPPDEGVIEVDGVAVTERTRAAYRQRFAAVPTDPALVPDPHAPPEAPRWSGGLSRGERKRAALAAALARGKPALVLDEVAADQDPAAKDHLYRTLLPALAHDGLAIVLVTHDDRYFPLADRLLHLRDGQLVPSPAPEIP